MWHEPDFINVKVINLMFGKSGLSQTYFVFTSALPTEHQWFIIDWEKGLYSVVMEMTEEEVSVACS
jgi:hypothetical protein